MKYYAVESSTDHLAHYGVKGMRWGVRRAIARGNDKALDRHYRKAAKKLAKLQDIGLNSSKYAAKSVAYGAAATGTGTLAVGGTNMLGNIISKPVKRIAESYAKRHDLNLYNGIGTAYPGSDKYDKIKRYREIRDADSNLKDWGNVASGLTRKDKSGKSVPITNNDLYRVGAGLVTAGLVAKSAQNAYRASHGVKYRAKAYEFKNAMDNAFAGTKYEGKYVVPPKKRRRKTK